MSRTVVETIPMKTYTIPTYKKEGELLIEKGSISLKFCGSDIEGVRTKDLVKALMMYTESKGLRTKDERLFHEALEEAYNQL